MSRPKPAGAVRRGGVAVRPPSAVALEAGELPPAPADFTDIERAAWDRYGHQLARVRQIAETDLATLELLCCAYADFRAARDALRLNGRTYEAAGREGATYPCARPEVAMASDAAKRMRTLLVELGMTPASRGKVERQPVASEKRRDAFDDVDALDDAPPTDA